MNLKVRVFRNVASNWLKLAVQLAVGFVLSPFILHKLGDAAFGIWVLIFSLTAYYFMFDFGILAAVPRYVARFVAIGDQEALARFVNTSLAACCALGLLILVVTGIGFHYLGAVFKIPADFLGTARILFLLVGADVALGFPLGVFGCVLEGYQSFERLNLTHICASLLRGLFIFLALSLGGGLQVMALAAVTVNLLRHLACAHIVLRTTPLRLGAKYVDRSMLGELTGFGAVFFVMTIAENLRFQSDAIVIGAFLSSTAITYYAIGSKLAEYPASIVSSLAQIFTPMASHYEASDDQEGLRKVFVAGNRACALVILPLCAILIVLGKPIIAVWVGTKYLSSYPILLVLIVSKTLFLGQSSSTRMLVGLGRLRLLTLVITLDGAANLILSIILLRHWGILGVALGTAIPLTCTSLFFLPQHLCRLLNVPWRTFLRQAYLLPLGLTSAMTVELLFLRQFTQPRSYGGLLLEVVSAGVVYGVAFLCFVMARQFPGGRLRLRLADLWQQASGR
jgi:O-antigen/teichoic acid export membrane protein